MLPLGCARDKALAPASRGRGGCRPVQLRVRADDYGSGGTAAGARSGAYRGGGRKIHVLGGRFDATSDNTDVHSVYDPATNSWSSAPFLPEPRSGGSAAFYHDRILLMGGECDVTKTFSQNEADDPKTMRWTALAPMPSAATGSMP